MLAFFHQHHLEICGFNKSPAVPTRPKLCPTYFSQIEKPTKHQLNNIVFDLGHQFTKLFQTSIVQKQVIQTQLKLQKPAVTKNKNQ